MKRSVHRAGIFDHEVAASVEPILYAINTYQAPSGILAFVHVEYGITASGVYSPGHGRIGLAWSTDNGDHFSYLGSILIPFNDPVAANVEGAPYIVKDGYFYVYYKDSCGGLAVARAPVFDVIYAASKGTTTAWYKYFNGGLGVNPNLDILNRDHIGQANGAVTIGWSPDEFGRSGQRGAYVAICENLGTCGSAAGRLGLRDDVRESLIPLLANFAVSTAITLAFLA